MTVVISLREIVRELDSVSDEHTAYLNRLTGEFVGLTEEFLRMAESDEEVDSRPDWQREVVQLAREVLDSDDYLTLPSKWDIHEYEIMRQFCLSVEEPDTSEDLLDAIRGSGAFRRFKALIRRRRLEDAWYSFRDQALAEVAVEWVQDNGLAYVRDLELGGSNP